MENFQRQSCFLPLEEVFWKFSEIFVFYCGFNSDVFRKSLRRHAFLAVWRSGCFLWWFIMLGPWSFSNDAIVNNPFFITSDNSFQKRIEFIAFKMQITSVDAFLHSHHIRYWFYVKNDFQNFHQILTFWYPLSQKKRFLRKWLSVCLSVVGRVRHNSR